ncbi:TRAP transporter small permease subunit [Alcaligenaceae bacterium]|nr:TRAP transporter small permease subunit [Alcaligenaceae bacterium]
MVYLLKLASTIDAINSYVGRIARWLILAAVLISAGNAVMRKLFSISSNAMLEVQWYLFSGVFLLAAGYTLLKNAHVRIDFVSSRLSARTRAIIEILAVLLVVTPFCWILIQLSWPLLVKAWESGEMSPDAGGLIRWPVYALVPVGMALLVAQAYSELIKRVAFLRGQYPDPGAAVQDPELTSKSN